MATYYELTREMIQRAIAECDAMGRDAFLETYGFKRAKAYVLLAGGQEYDSKAIVAVAHNWEPSVKRPLSASELSGGIDGAVAPLLRLGFEVRMPAHDRDWTWDEHVLALQLYVSHPLHTPDKKSAEIAELSETLRRLGGRLGVPLSDKYRNANGVYMKLMNFRRLDPAFKVAGKVGLTRGASGEKAVWDRYAADASGLNAAAMLIRLAIEDANVRLDLPDEDYETEEGRAVLRLHWARERDAKLVRLKKDQVLKSTGSLICEVCDFEFRARYGAHGANFIEAHHRRPVASLKPGQKAKTADLALVCSNCHRMLHRGPQLLTVEQLRSLLIDN